MFFATIVCIALVWWIYQSCVKAGITPWKPVVISLLSFFLSMQLCNNLLMELLVGKSQVNQHSMGIGLTIQITSVLIGIIVVVLIRRLILRKH